MDRPDVTLEISDLFLAETIYSHSQQDTDAIGRMLSRLLDEHGPVMLRRDDTNNIISLLAEPKTGKTHLAHAIATACTGKGNPDFTSDFINRDLPAWSIWRDNKTHICNSDSILEDWGKCTPPPPSLLPITYRMIEHASADLQLLSTFVIGMEKIADDIDSPRKIEIFINPRCNAAEDIQRRLHSRNFKL